MLVVMALVDLTVIHSAPTVTKALKLTFASSLTSTSCASASSLTRAVSLRLIQSRCDWEILIVAETSLQVMVTLPWRASVSVLEETVMVSSLLSLVVLTRIQLSEELAVHS